VRTVLLAWIDRCRRRPLFWAGVLVALALALGYVLRASGTNFCLPMEHCHPDEHWLVKPVLAMLRTGDLNPHSFVYPTLYMYILLGVFAATFLSIGGAMRTSAYLLAGRLTTATLGTGTVGAVYLTGRRLFDGPTGAVAALALAVMPLHVQTSHFVTTDVPAGFFSALALLAAARVTDEGSRRHYVWAGLLVGLAAAAKYNAALVALNIPLAHFANPRRERFFDANLARALAFVPVGFLIACPHALLDLPRFLDGVAEEMAHYRRAHVGHEGEHNLLFYFLFLAGRGFGPVLCGLGLFGLVELVRKLERRHLLLLVFPALYLIFLGSFKVRFVRNLMPVLPYLALLIGHGAVSAFHLARAGWAALGRARAGPLAAVGLAAAVAWPLAISIDETVAFTRPDTRLLAKVWLEQHVPPRAAVYLQTWSVDALPPRIVISRDRWAWDYYVATDRLSRKYFAMETVVPEKYLEVLEAFQHRPVAVFEGREENPFEATASPTVLIFERDPRRPRVHAPAPPRPPAPKPPPPRPPAVKPVR
jgi:hypothetical protein